MGCMGLSAKEKGMEATQQHCKNSLSKGNGLVNVVLVVQLTILTISPNLPRVLTQPQTRNSGTNPDLSPDLNRHPSSGDEPWT